MIYTARLKLTTNFLGGGKRQKTSSVRSLEYTHDERVAMNENEWRKSFDLALKQLELDFDIEKFIFESGFDAKGKIKVLRRVYNKVNVDLFEGIERDNEIEIQFVYKEDPKKSPDVGAIEKVLEIVGRFYGMSQWGCKFHCGRFKVLEVKRIIYNE